jgi:hypothetical protein
MDILVPLQQRQPVPLRGLGGPPADAFGERAGSSTGFHPAMEF